MKRLTEKQAHNTHYLTMLVNKLAQKYFHENFSPHQVLWTNRMTTSEGEVHYWSHYDMKTHQWHRNISMKINIVAFLHNDYTELVDTIKHELIHYTLWKENKPCGHNKTFHKIAKKIGCAVHCPPPEEWIKPIHHFQYIYKYPPQDHVRPIYTMGFIPQYCLDKDKYGHEGKLVYIKDKNKYRKDVKEAKEIRQDHRNMINKLIRRKENNYE